MGANEGNLGGHSAHGGHAHHGPPPPPEPKTPMWLPAVGAVLFLTVGLIWGLSSPPADASSAAPPPSSATARADAGALPPGHP